MHGLRFPGCNCPGGQFCGMHFLTNALKYRQLRFRIIVVARCSARASQL
jgi:hypothetical protein